MRREGQMQNIIIALLAITVLAMSIGYATYSQVLNINGSATFSKAKWDVHFDTTTFNETSTIKATTKDVGNTSISYSVTLPAPGDTYSFTVNAKNFGTIAANMTKLTMTGLTSAQQNFITYTVSYNGTSYNATTDGLSIPLAAEASHPVVVTVSYILPADANNLPSEDTTVNLNVSLDYEDAA